MFSLFGQKVQVQQELFRSCLNDVFTWKTIRPHYRGPVKGPLPVGWVVGFRWLLTGRVIPGTQPGWGIENYDTGEPPEFRETGPRIPCLLVAYWPTLTPVKVPLDGYAVVKEDDVLAVPYGPAAATPWSDRDRELYREFAAKQPRDAKGRFHHVEK